MSNQGETRNAIVKNVQLFWANNLVKPSSPFGEDIYDLQVRVPMKRRSELEAFAKVREIDGMAVINVRKKAFKADGTPSKKPAVVDGNKEPLDARTVGNGSVGNIRLRLNDYQILHPKTGAVTKEGTKVTLEGVQVTKLIVFAMTGGGDFNDFDEEEMEVVEPEEADEAQPAPTTKMKKAVLGAGVARAKVEAEEDEAEVEEEEEEAPAPSKKSKPVNAGLAAYQAKKAAEKEATEENAAKKPAVKKFIDNVKKPAAPISKKRVNSDY